MPWMMVLTAPAVRGLSDADVMAAARQIGPGAGEPARLGPLAAEIPCPQRPSSSTWPAPDGVDVNIVPTAGREKRVLIADMDSTMIQSECIDELAADAGVGPHVAEVTERAMAGELDFEAALAERVSLLAGLPESALASVWATRIALSPGARTLVQTMADRGAATALVSGGFTAFTARVADACGFHEHRANRLEIIDGLLTGRVLSPILERDAKRAALEELTARHGLTPANALCIGDGANDLAMIEAAGLGVGYRPKPLLAAACDAVVAHADLTAALSLQGIPSAEFVDA